MVVERYSYDVFDEPNTTSSVGNPYMFTGRRYDSEAGLYYYRARYYAYVGNNPIVYLDPIGLAKRKQSKWDRFKVAFWSGVGDSAGWIYDNLGGESISKGHFNFRCLKKNPLQCRGLTFKNYPAIPAFAGDKLYIMGSFGLFFFVSLGSLPTATKCDLVLKNTTPCEMAGVAMQVSFIRFTASNSN